MTKQRQLFAFGFGLAFVGEAQAGPDYCCVIPATIHCSEGIGTWFAYSYPIPAHCAYQLHPGDDLFCQIQVPPQCQ